jgi:membrane protease YdiL (CAAX protease family)
LKERIPFFLLFLAALTVWWVSGHLLTSWIEQLAGYDNIQDKDIKVLVHHWLLGDLPRTILCVGVWLVAYRFGLMPSLFKSLTSGGSWKRVVITGIIGTAIMMAIIIGTGIAAEGKFGFFPYYTKMAGDVVSNMYEEIIYRGLIFNSLYGVFAATSFSLDGKLSRIGMIAAAIGSSFIFGYSHSQYPVAFRVIIGTGAIVFCYQWVKSRSLWSTWMSHTLVDIITDSTLKL